MATSYTTRAKLQKPANADRGWDVPVNANADALDLINAIGSLCVTLHETPSTTLNVAIAAGSFRKADGSIVTYAGTASQAITASTTKSLYLTNAGSLTVGSAFPTSGPYFPLAVVVAGATTITSVTDARPMPTVVSGSANCGTAVLVAGSKVVTCPQVTASSNIQLTSQVDGGTPGFVRVSARTAGTSFTVTSSSSSDTSTVGWILLEP